MLRAVVLASVVGPPGRGYFCCGSPSGVFVISRHSHSSMSEPPENERMARAVLCKSWNLPLARSSTMWRRSDCGTCTGLHACGSSRHCCEANWSEMLSNIGIGVCVARLNTHSTIFIITYTVPGTFMV